MRVLVVLLAALALPAAAAAQITMAPAPPQLPARAASNAAMSAIYAADQADRLDPATGKERLAMSIDWRKVGLADGARREQVRGLLKAGTLRTAQDFRYAAFVFQHGGAADDYLLAHTLAVISASKGDPEAVWISAATLDRYLLSKDQKQVFGTQYQMRPGKDAAFTQEPFDRALISDALRAQLRVVPLETQGRLGDDLTARLPRP